MEKAQPFQLLSLGEVLQAAKIETFRWTPKRKAVVVEAVRDRALSESDVVRRLGVSPEELAAWQSQHEKHGLAGLSQSNFHVLRRNDTRPGHAGRGRPRWRLPIAATVMRARLG